MGDKYPIAGHSGPRCQLEEIAVDRGLPSHQVADRCLMAGPREEGVWG